MQGVRNGLAGLWRAAAMLVAGLALAGCTVSLVPAYDAEIDRGLTALYSDTAVFVDKMIANEGKPAGSFAENGDFYDSAFGRTEALIVRAQAHRALNNCPTTKVMARFLAKADLPSEVAGQVGALHQDDCQVQLMTLIKQSYTDMRDLHRLRGDRGLPPEAKGQFIDGGVGALLRAAITVEIAKRAE